MSIALALGTLSFLLAVIWGSPFIRWLKAHGIGKKIRIEEPDSNQVKMGTPTMGGIDGSGTGVGHYPDPEHLQFAGGGYHRRIRAGAAIYDGGVWDFGRL